MRTIRHSRHSLPCFALLILSAAAAMAQVYYGSLTGTVTDSTGASISSAAITVTEINKGTVTKTVSNQAGIYLAGNLTPGRYRFEAEAAGFKKFVQESVLVESGRAFTIDVALKVGGVSESITVSGAAPILETESGKTTVTLNGDMVSKMVVGPTAHADLRTIVMTLPGTSYGADSRMMISGARSNQVRWDYDGVVSRNPINGMAGAEHTLNIQAIGEYKFTLVNAGAESPAPAQLSFLTKSGTNEFHGNTYWFTHHSFMDAGNHNLPAGAKVPFSRQTYLGYQVTGPVVIPRLYNGKNRTFFMNTVEYNNMPSRTFSYTTMPTAAMRAGDFSNYKSSLGVMIPIKDPTTGDVFANNQIPTSRLYAGSQNYLNAYYPLPNVETTTFSNNYYGLDSIGRNIGWRWDARIDHSINQKNNFFFRVNQFQNPDSATSTFRGTGDNLSAFHMFAFQVSDTHTFAPNLLNEFRWGVTGTGNHARTGVNAASTIKMLGITGISEKLYPADRMTLPDISISGVGNLTVYGHSDDQAHVWDFYDNVTFVRGRHSLKFGTAFNRNSKTSLSWPRPGGFNFTGKYSGFGLSDFLLGIPYTANNPYPRAELGDTDLRYWALSFYAQDDIKLTPRLTINAGLRWDATFPAQETHGLYYNVDPLTGNLIMPSQATIDRIVPSFPSRAFGNVKVVTAEQAGYPSTLRNTDFNNFGPRLGIAWRPWGDKFVVRTAYGVYYDHISNSTVTDSAPWGGSAVYTNAITDGVPTWKWPTAFPTSGAYYSSTVGVNGVNPNLKNPYVQQWNFTLERQAGNYLLRAQYVGSKATNLAWVHDVNTPYPSTTPFSTSRRRYQQYVDMIYRDQGGNNTYNALNMAVERRFRSGFTLNSNYSFQKDLTDSYEAGEITALRSGYGVYNGNFFRSKWKGNETHVPRHRFTSSWLYELPVGRGKKFASGIPGILDRFVGGWTWTGIANIESGFWMTPYYSSGPDTTGTNWTAGVPDRIVDGVLSNSGLHPKQFFLDPKAFVIPAANIGRFGSSGTNFLEEPSWWTCSMSMMKVIPVKEQVRLEIEAQVDNVFNHGYWWHGAFSGGLNMSNPATFGTMTGSYRGSRTFAFNTRLAW